MYDDDENNELDAEGFASKFIYIYIYIYIRVCFLLRRYPITNESTTL